MRVDKRRLLNIFLKDLERNCPEAVQRNGWIHAARYLESKGYHGEKSLRMESERNSIKFKLFSFPPFQGGESYWIRLPRDPAEKILVFGTVPEINEDEGYNKGKGKPYTPTRRKKNVYDREGCDQVAQDPFRRRCDADVRE